MKETFHLLVLTPYGRYFEGEAEFIEVRSEKYSMGIYPHHAPLVSTIDISKMVIRLPGQDFIYAISGGVVNVEEGKVTIIANSIEREDEIDVERAKRAKERAEERLKEKASNDEVIDVNRAKAALLRALNRINVSSKE